MSTCIRHRPVAHWDDLDKPHTLLFTSDERMMDELDGPMMPTRFQPSTTSSVSLRRPHVRRLCGWVSRILGVSQPENLYCILLGLLSYNRSSPYLHIMTRRLCLAVYHTICFGVARPSLCIWRVSTRDETRLWPGTQLP